MNGEGSPQHGCRRVFLGWDRPLLERAAGWLLEAAAPGMGLDRTRSLDSWLVVVPGRRAGRRLLERLAEAAPGGPALLPPSIGTVGALPELLSDLGPTAGPVESLCARLETVRSAPLARLRTLFPEPPAADDLDSWLELARELERIERELAASLYRPRDVARIVAGGVAERETERWRALADLQDRYERRLQRAGRRSRHAAALDATTGDAVSGRARRAVHLRSVALLGLTELPALARRVLELAGVEIVALVGAPEELAAAFDSWGCPEPEAWLQRPVALEGAELVAADRPVAQAASVAVRVAEWIEGGVSPSEIAVAAGSATSVDLLEDALVRAGLEPHAPAGASAVASEPMVVLRRIARYLEAPSADTLSALLRAPAVESALDRALPAGWLTALDAELAAGPAPSAGPLQRADATSAVEAALGAVFGNESGVWAATVETTLARLFGEYRFDPADPADRPGVEALEAIAEHLAEIGRCPPAQVYSFGEGVAFLERLVGDDEGRAEPTSVSDAIELLGWLDVAVDDAPFVVVTDLNEGIVPAAAVADPFLTEGLRQRLGLSSDLRRRSRDLLHLEQLLRSREDLVLCWTRRDADGQPRKPSRLLLQQRGPELARTVRRVGGAESDQRGAALWSPASRSAFSIPLPEPPAEPPDALSVTALRDYLACPYRFYLRHVLALEPARTVLRELAADVFGTLAHEVLGRFARGRFASETRAATIERELARLLAGAAARYEACGGAAVAVQIEQLARRLRVFARWQAEQVAAGWRIDPEWVERRVEIVLGGGEEPRLVGRIDRVDRHRDGRLRVIDYKTKERPETPHQSHGGPGPRRRDSVWRDLQLPLYGYAVRQHEGADAWPVLSIYALSKKLEADPLLVAAWDEAALDSAIAEARRVIGLIRAGVFWPPGEPPRWDDGFAGIVGDRFGRLYRRHAGEGGAP